MRVTEYTPRDPFRVLEHRHDLAEIVESMSINFTQISEMQQIA